MAEIKIEKKPPVWPWILLGLLLLGGLIYWFALRDNDVDATADMTDSTDLVMDDNMASPDAVNDYLTFIDGDPDPMGLDHEYTNAALMKLSAAIETLASTNGYDVKADLDQAREYARMIEEDPMEGTHANSIRKSTETMSAALHRMQEAKYPQLSGEAQSVVDAAKKINPDVLTLDQKPAVKGYFSEAASLIRKMI